MEDAIGGLSISNNIFLALGEIEKKSMTMKEKEWEALDRKELGTIRLCLETSMAFDI
jgi:hypothetical protein